MKAVKKILRSQADAARMLWTLGIVLLRVPRMATLTIKTSSPQQQRNVDLAQARRQKSQVIPSPTNSKFKKEHPLTKVYNH